jgi:hypothetical protein
VVPRCGSLRLWKGGWGGKGGEGFEDAGYW